ncbi:MAG: hypothetical protein AB1847_21020 [bacterium]
MSRIKKIYFIILLSVFIVAIASQKGRCQYLGVPYPPFIPWSMVPPVQLLPAPALPIPYTRAPQATIIISPGVTAVSTAPGVVVIGAPTVVTPAAAPTVVSTVPTATATAAAPAPLLGILVTLYSSAIYSPTPLSIANPLLFAYLSTLLL